MPCSLVAYIRITLMQLDSYDDIREMPRVALLWATDIADSRYDGSLSLQLTSVDLDCSCQGSLPNDMEENFAEVVALRVSEQDVQWSLLASDYFRQGHAQADVLQSRRGDGSLRSCKSLL